MAVSGAQIEAKIHDALPGARVEVRDTTGGGDHWAAVVVASAFEGKTLVERHRMIYAALGDWMRAEIHALALTTHTPGEGEQKT
jgi:stress-induced morphogen